MRNCAENVVFFVLLACVCLWLDDRTYAAGARDSACPALHYKLTSLPLIPAAINASGTIVGRTSEHRAAVWSVHSGLQALDLPAGFDESEAVGISDHGVVVGNVRNRLSQKIRAFYYENGRLSILPGDPARASAINDAEEIAGQYLATSGVMAPAHWRRFKLFPLPNCCGGSVSAINDSGEIIGDLYDSNGQYHAAVWEGSDPPTIIGPTVGFSAALGINARGTIIVRTISDTFLYAAGLLRRLDVPRERRLKALAINRCDVVVGAFGPNKDANRAFLWHESIGFRDLNSEVPDGSGWVLESATAINDRGVIVGTGDLDRGEDSGFMLVPLAQ